MQFQHGRALVIGLANYAEVNKLPEAVINDARDIASVFRASEYCGLPPANVHLLLDSQATLAAIRNALADLAINSVADDTVLIFFSGHGTRFVQETEQTSALVAYDTRFSDLSGTTLPESELSLALSRIKSRRLVVFIDACHAGGTSTLKGELASDMDYGFDDKSLQRLADGAGRVIMASSRSTEKSRVLGNSRNSVFTGKLLDALQGKVDGLRDGLIRVFDVFNYVAEHVAQDVPGLQHPVFKATDLESNFPIALRCGGTKALKMGYEIPISPRSLDKILSKLYPLGPTDQDIWIRAGGDISRLRLSGTGRSNWFAACRLLAMGGGGSITQQSLIEAALDDYPFHADLSTILKHPS
ncbi:caspase family protein [Massilia sp. GCM10023247]|uniref:caspase family protein n=1 Tax=Massilia sp. GCM10023247 TaxID=3252643 RepID=UPI00361A27E7